MHDDGLPVEHFRQPGSGKATFIQHILGTLTQQQGR
jgi:ABC-type transport system involved in cytochrome bd biosynthesis fused ATPase/permease subunit